MCDLHTGHQPRLSVNGTAPSGRRRKAALVLVQSDVWGRDESKYLPPDWTRTAWLMQVLDSPSSEVGREAWEASVASEVKRWTTVRRQSSLSLSLLLIFIIIYERKTSRLSLALLRQHNRLTSSCFAVECYCVWLKGGRAWKAIILFSLTEYLTLIHSYDLNVHFCVRVFVYNCSFL